VRGLEDVQRRLESVQALLSNVPDPVILVDADGLVREANAAAHALLPRLRLGQPLFYAVRAPEILAAVAQAPGRSGSVHVEYHERVPTERTFEVQIGALPSRGRDTLGKPDVMLFFRDLTTARGLERMRVDFVANASHELRTPLASVLGFIETLQGPARNDSAARDRFLDIMREQAQRMTRLIDDLLSLSRIELRAHVPPESTVDLRSIVLQMLDSLAPLGRDRGVEIGLAADDGGLTVRGDRDELLRVVENLVENAVKYGAEGGRIDVALRRLTDGDGAEIALIVRDYGPGIAPEHLPRLTERFYRVDVTASREQGGTGLGLAIVKHIVNRHRGRLQIESELGQGARFSVILPAHAGAAVI
jgi:two-component system, OmpR family, phosphate regulon sensor histidine kinase PhoR